MTDNNNKNNKDIVAIDVKSLSSSTTKGSYYCNMDSFKLVLLNKNTGEWICPRCFKSYFPNQEPVKKADKFSTPGPDTDAHGNIIAGSDDVLVSYTPDNYGNSPLSTAYYQKENKTLPPFFEQLKKKRFKITHYEEKVGGRS